MKKANRILSIILVILMVISIIPITASADTPTSGTLGETVTWEFDESTGTLTFFGEGAIPSYLDLDLQGSMTYDNRPWAGFIRDITVLIINEGIVGIGQSAFVRCSNLETVAIPKSVTRICGIAFDATNIKTVIYNGTADEWKQITIDYWQNNALYDATYYFNDSASLNSGKCGDNLIWTFDEETYTLTISGSGDMYDYDTNSRPWGKYEDLIRNVHIDESVTGIGTYAFYSLDGLKSVTIPDNVTRLQEGVFAECSSLESVVIGNSVTSIGVEAFANCKSLKEVTIPKSVSIADMHAFDSCSNLKNVYYLGSQEQWSSIRCISLGLLNPISKATKTYLGTQGEIDFPTSGKCGENLTWNFDEETNSLTISGTGAMYDYPYLALYSSHPWGPYEKEITSLVIGENVTTIGGHAFTDLATENVTISSNITSIGRGAFDGSKVKCVVIEEGLQSIGGGAFRYSTLTEISIPNSVTSIGDYAFGSCKRLETIEIPEGVTTIDRYCFENCINLKNVSLPSTLTSLGECAFNTCSNLESIILPGSLEIIDRITFNCCSSLKSVTIGEGTTKIDYRAFQSCTSLETVILPTSITYIGENIFYDCNTNIDIYYTGSEEQWNNIEVYKIEYTLKNTTIHYNYGKFTGIKDNHFYKDDVMQKAYQLVEFEGDFYFIGDRHEIVKNKTTYLNEARINGLTYADGTPIAVGYYDFDENGKMVLREGIVGNHIYENNTMLKAYQLVEVDGDFYYIGDRHEIVKNKRVYLKEERINGLTYADGTPITAGYYDFDENGKMVMLNGIVGNNIYKNNTKLKAYQLVEIDGDFYFIGDRHEIVKNKKTYLNEERINGLTYADGTPIAVGYYEFDENGKMIILNGIVGNNIYKNNTKLKAYQLVEIDGDFYFIGDRHEIVKDKKIYLNEERINGLTYADGTPIATGYHNVDADGKLITE